MVKGSSAPSGASPATAGGSPLAESNSTGEGLTECEQGPGATRRGDENSVGIGDDVHSGGYGLSQVADPRP
jgi:hypothetical protein